jgi:hypothetical protein
MSEINDKYLALLPTLPWLGAPDGGERTCTDGVGRYQEYKGGASIYWTPTTGAHVLYGKIRSKWIALGREKGPNGYPTSDEVDTASGSGRENTFQHGVVTWKRGTTEAFTVYGKIFSKWNGLQRDAGPLGYPLTDEKAANGGRFNDFERGAIYWRSGAGAIVVRSPILDAWSWAGRETGLFKWPTSDTPVAKNAQGELVQPFEGGKIACTEGASRSLVTSALLNARIMPISRSLSLSNAPATAAAWAKPGVDDTRVCKLTRLNRKFRLNTALVIFRGSYTRTFGDPEIQTLKDSHHTARDRMNAFNFGLAGMNTTVFVIEQVLAKSDFKDYAPQDTTVFAAELKAYDKVTAAIEAEGQAVEEFDIIQICIPWMNLPEGSKTPTDVASGFAWANPTTDINGSGIPTFDGKAWSTVHYIPPKPPDAKPYWWAFFVHEATHCIEFMLQDAGYPALRNNDDAWWEACYPKITSSTIVPTPENVKDPAGPIDPRLYAMHQRIKSSWLSIAPTWGKVTSDATTLENYGSLLTYACPNEHALVETAWSVHYRDLPDGECGSIASKITALTNQKQALAEELSKAAPGDKPELAGQILTLNKEIAALKDKQKFCDAKAALLAKS